MDRAVLITGASRGIGAAVARRFAREGWRVGVNYRTSRGRAEALGSRDRRRRGTDRPPARRCV